MWRSSHLSYGLLARLVQGGDPITQAELDEIAECGRDESALGLLVEDRTRATGLGGTMFWDALVDVATPADHVHLLVAAPRILRMLDAVLVSIRTFVVEGHQQRAQAERAAQTLHDELLRGVAGPRADAAPRVRLTDEMRPFELAVPGASPWQHSEVAEGLRSAGAVAVTRPDRVLGFLPADADIGLLPREPASVALGTLRPQAELADAALAIAGLLDTSARVGRTGVVGPADLIAERLLLASPQLAAGVTARITGPLIVPDDARAADLMGTLLTFLDNDLDRRRAAAALDIHPSTLAYRLSRIAELTGMRFDRADDLALLSFARTALRPGAA